MTTFQEQKKYISIIIRYVLQNQTNAQICRQMMLQCVQ